LHHWPIKEVGRQYHRGPRTAAQCPSGIAPYKLNSLHFVAFDRRRTLSVQGSADAPRSAGFHHNGNGKGNGKHHFRFRQSLPPEATRK
jgi:hypothetical protein